MKYKLFVCFVSVLTTVFICKAQEGNPLHEILNIDLDLDVKQNKIDSFIHVMDKSGFPLGDLCHDIGSKWYFKKWKVTRKQEDIKQAVFYTKRAVSIKKENDSLDYKSIKKSLYNLGYFHSLNDEVFDAINSYLSLIELKNEDNKTQSARRELGIAYNTIGDFHKALSIFNKVVSFYQGDLSNTGRLASAYIELANTYMLMGFEENSAEIRSNLQKAKALINKGFKGHNSLLLRLNQIEGNRLLSLGEYQKAISYHQKVAEALPKNKPIDLAIVHNSLAVSYQRLGDYGNAMANLEKSIEYDSSHTDTYENQGDLLIKQGEFEKALDSYQKAIIYATDRKRRVKFDENLEIHDLERSAEKHFLLNYIISKANGWVSYFKHSRDKSHLDQALNTFAVADKLVDLIRFESTEYKSKLFWRQKGASLYMKAIEACYLLGKPEDAYYYMEKNKALHLLEDITNEQAKEITNLPESVAKREFELKRAIFLAENELQNILGTDKAVLDGYNEKIDRSKREHEKFMDSLVNAYPDYAKLKKKVDILSFSAFTKKYLQEGEVVAQYIMSESGGYGLLSTAHETMFFPLDTTGILNQNIIKLYGFLTDIISSVQRMDDYRNISFLVFKSLIPPHAYKLIKGKRMTVIPDHTLQQIPFETLVVEKNNLKYLIEDVEIRYAYSMSHLELNDQIERDPTKGFVGFAPVTFDKLALSRLRFSNDEITEVENIYGGDILIDKQATKSIFLDKMPYYRIIHLSTHASVGQKGNPWIAFSDDKISLTEIYATKNQSDMVVLSGCQTSLGERVRGEGIMSLARGFFHSGTKSVVSSLWSIIDQTSKELIVDFYSGLDKGLTKSAALRQAKLKYINNHTGSELAPFYWGGLIVIGDNAELKPPSFLNLPGAWLWLVVVAVLLAIIFFMWIYRRRKQGLRPSN